MPLGLSPHDCLSNNLPGIPRRHYCGNILLMMPFPPVVERGMTQSLLCSHRPLLSVSPVLGLSIPAPIFSFGDNFCCHLVQIGIGHMTATTFLLLLLGAKFCLRDKVAIQQALDRTGMHDSAQLIRSIIAT